MTYIKISKILIYSIGILFSLSALYTATFGVFDEIYQRTITIGASVILSILAFPLVERIRTSWRLARFLCWVVDAILMGLISLSIFWFSQVYDELESGLYEFDSLDLTIAAGGLLAVVELTRRAFGMPLASLAVLCMIYALFGENLPWIFAHAGYDLESTIRTVWYSFDGVFGFIVITVISLIFIFIVFGAVLEATGAGAVLLRIAVSLTGGLPGGPAHAAIAASGVFGTISGSVTANVVGTGVFTIPMIKERGFKNSFAGGVEAAASTGGQIMPPVMGAVAFVMADITGISYLTIVCAAIIPALFYYGSLFVAVWVEAARNDIKAVPRNERPPAANFVQAALTNKIRFLGATDADWEKPAMKKVMRLPGRTRGQFPSDIYGSNQANTKPVQTIAAWVGLVTRKGIPEEVIYKMTKTFWEHIDEMYAVGPWVKDALNLKNAFTQINMKLHSGAVKYYKERGIKMPKSAL